MPSRWFVPIRGVDATRVRLEFTHAAFSRWFDRSGAEHAANDKPYAVSPLTDYKGRVGAEISTLTDDAERRLWAAIEADTPIRLGTQTRQIGRPARLHTTTWGGMAAEAAGEREWTLEFVTPTTFRSGDRSSPLPTLPTVMGGLSRAWNLWSGLDRREYDPRVDGALWVSDLDLRSTLIELEIRDRHGALKPIHLSCCLGALTLRCDDPATAARVAPLIRLAAYAGVGSMRGKGLGVVRVHTWVGGRRQGRPRGDRCGAAG